MFYHEFYKESGGIKREKKEKERKTERKRTKENDKIFRGFSIEIKRESKSVKIILKKYRKRIEFLYLARVFKCLYTFNSLFTSQFSVCLFPVIQIVLSQMEKIRHLISAILNFFFLIFFRCVVCCVQQNFI